MENTLNKDLNYIVFRNTAKSISDYEVEERYQQLKDIRYIEISNYTLLHRFLLGVKRKEIPQFNFIVYDLDESVHSEIVNELGELTHNIWGTKILSMCLRYNDELLWGTNEKLEN